MVLVDVVSGVSADMDTDAMVAGDSGSKHNGGRSAVCAVNSMVSEASAATVAVLDVIGGVSAGMVTNATVVFGSGSERNDSGSPHGGSRRKYRQQRLQRHRQQVFRREGGDRDLGGCGQSYDVRARR
ncbi:hypothetical protein PHYSODRAFT_341737 [Phytophthora sojae]|uniref:Uncharacterized protein n=1 Tax=Phytophthora sojae (strain P6497) TaxID=1094619 RepID=G5AE76_PHYSP|nr:hypothetical protein PHYSODRAFT_341737 [Phytophthora sojae]EGZ06478.1 hypothetical protein PHYSODRAFT_341737 [Phytophthora sojae]|eukprot:XP_009538375.1 hypothetical protein PHYSODRAFT_341737 [Phytophthora sojae]